MLVEILNSIVSVVFPPTCISCGEIQSDFRVKVCSSCWNRFNELDSFVLENKVYTEYLDVLLAVYVFDEHFQKVMHMIKYSGFKSIAYRLGYDIGEKLKKSVPWVLGYDLIIPIPLNPVKKRERGYNQSEVIAKGLSESTGIEVDNGSLTRWKYTVSQTSLGVKERKENVENAFSLSDGGKAVKGKKIILLDDVVTTGATINYAGRVLKDAGAAKVAGLATATPLMD